MLPGSYAACALKPGATEAQGSPAPVPDDGRRTACVARRCSVQPCNVWRAVWAYSELVWLSIAIRGCSGQIRRSVPREPMRAARARACDGVCVCMRACLRGAREQCLRLALPAPHSAAVGTSRRDAAQAAQPPRCAAPTDPIMPAALADARRWRMRGVGGCAASALAVAGGGTEAGAGAAAADGDVLHLRPRVRPGVAADPRAAVHEGKPGPPNAAYPAPWRAPRSRARRFRLVRQSARPLTAGSRRASECRGTPGTRGPLYSSRWLRVLAPRCAGRVAFVRPQRSLAWVQKWEADQAVLPPER